MFVCARETMRIDSDEWNNRKCVCTLECTGWLKLGCLQNVCDFLCIACKQYLNNEDFSINVTAKHVFCILELWMKNMTKNMTSYDINSIICVQVQLFSHFNALSDITQVDESGIIAL